MEDTQLHSEAAGGKDMREKWNGFFQTQALQSPHWCHPMAESRENPALTQPMIHSLQESTSL